MGGLAGSSRCYKSDFMPTPITNGVRENASLAELEAEMKKHWMRLAPVLDLEALVAPSDGVANRKVPHSASANVNGQLISRLHRQT
jgi:hypothetical protein